MIPQPMRFVHGQALRPETFNQLLDTLRRMQPIQGAGIKLQYTLSGVIISVTGAKVQSPVAQSTTLEPWECIQVDGEWYMVAGVWEMEKTDSVSGSAQAPVPTELKIEQTTAKEHKGFALWEMPAISASSGTFYAYFSQDGTVSIEEMTGLDAARYPNCIPIAKYVAKKDSAASESPIESVTQLNKGIFKTTWTETEPFYIEQVGGSGGVVLRTDAPIGLEENTTIEHSRFWQATTTIKGREYATALDLNFSAEYVSFPQYQVASHYGSYIYLYQTYFSRTSQCLLVANETTPVLNVGHEEFAHKVKQTYVDKIEVAYPESPLEQGHVTAVGGSIDVLAITPKETTRTLLFSTECIDTQQGNLIEVEGE